MRVKSFEVASLDCEELQAPGSRRKVDFLFRTEVSVKGGFPDPEGDRLEKDIRDIGITPEEWTRVSDVDHLEGELKEAEATQIGRELLADSVLEYSS